MSEISQQFEMEIRICNLERKMFQNTHTSYHTTDQIIPCMCQQWQHG